MSPVADTGWARGWTKGFWQGKVGAWIRRQAIGNLIGTAVVIMGMTLNSGLPKTAAPAAPKSPSVRPAGRMPRASSLPQPVLANSHRSLVHARPHRKVSDEEVSQFVRGLMAARVHELSGGVPSDAVPPEVHGYRASPGSAGLVARTAKRDGSSGG